MATETEKLRALLGTRFLPFSLSLLVLIHFLVLLGSYTSSKSIVHYEMPTALRDAGLFGHAEGWPFVNWFSVSLHPDSTFPEILIIEWPGLIANLTLTLGCTVCTYIMFDRLRANKSRFQLSLRDFAAIVLMLSILLAIFIQVRYVDSQMLPYFGLMRSNELPQFQPAIFVVIGLVCLVLVLSSRIIGIVAGRLVGREKPNGEHAG